jgi:hypothetical protein
MSERTAIDRHAVAKRFGPPTEQVGSVNDPRSHEEYGVKWNEKWVYRDPEGDGNDLLVLWNRYDLLGVFTLKPDGGAEPESLAE